MLGESGNLLSESEQLSKIGNLLSESGGVWSESETWDMLRERRESKDGEERIDGLIVLQYWGGDLRGLQERSEKGRNIYRGPRGWSWRCA